MTKSSECAAPLATTLRKRQQVRADEDEPASRPGNWTGKPTDVCVANPPRHLPARSSESQYSQRRSSTTLATGSESARPWAKRSAPAARGEFCFVFSVLRDGGVVATLR